MNPKRKKKLILILSLFAGFACVFALAFYSLKGNLDHFYSPHEVLEGQVKPGQRLKVGGIVKDHSVVHSEDSLDVTFIVTDTLGDVIINYTGILPDLFREGQGVVIQGVLTEQGGVDADKVLAKHDDNYTPPEAAAALMKAAEKQEQDAAKKYSNQ